MMPDAHHLGEGGWCTLLTEQKCFWWIHSLFDTRLDCKIGISWLAADLSLDSSTPVKGINL